MLHMDGRMQRMKGKEDNSIVRVSAFSVEWNSNEINA